MSADRSVQRKYYEDVVSYVQSGYASETTGDSPARLTYATVRSYEQASGEVIDDGSS